MSETPDLWILSAAARDAAETARIAAWMENACDAAPVQVELADQSLVWLESYFPDPVAASLLLQVLRTEFPGVPAEIRHCGARDWTTFWRHHFPPLRVADTLLILPEWLRDQPAPSPDCQVILINPGLSFGTGHHFTTRFCLEMLCRLRAEGFPGGPMLDAGCGSAILSVAARKFGWGPVLAVDHDALALESAVDNLRLNGIEEGVQLRQLDLTREPIPGTYPLLVANLYAGLLLELAPRLVRACTGRMILSGIRTLEADAVSSIFAQCGAVERVCEADPEWCGLLLDCSVRS